MCAIFPPNAERNVVGICREEEHPLSTRGLQERKDADTIFVGASCDGVGPVDKLDALVGNQREGVSPEHSASIVRGLARTLAPN